MFKKFFITMAVAFAFFSAKAQVYKGNNQVAILPSDSDKDIIRKAATVTPSVRQLRWQQLELTAFFHFGVNTFTNKEWGDGTEDEKVFNPTNLDARQWIRTMKEAGFKQVILTTKHHDGFCLWPSKYTEHSVKNSLWKNGKGDVVKEVSDACHEYGLGFGVYLSPWDRNNPNYGLGQPYDEHFMNQLTELLTQYGKVDEVWFDGAYGMGKNDKKQEYNFDAWYAHIRKLQPEATIVIMGPDVRWVGTESGYGRETEWSVIPADDNMLKKIADNSQKDVAFAPVGDKTAEDLGSRKEILKAKGLVWYPAETDVSIREGWFWHADQDDKIKSVDKLMDIYFSSVGRNSVLLLNVPPDKTGQINKNDIKVLKEWTAKRQKIFATNLAKGAIVKTSNGKNGKAILDGIYKTNYIASPKDTTATIALTLKRAQTFDVLSLQENITIGQRIEKFVLEYKEGNKWKKATEGTTVGYKRLLRFNPVKAKDVRLRILSSRLNPTISAFGLYKQ
ncbi:alpha-L-fucosidase [Pedobacter paludis]|uniref:alpha-L-fucosidase n=1 Tax=Pedobacter paludis TaxID=2203212 RepID=A0A317F114_9SPHI|nr:alpha-L-fucosidase [Pedobacter paludis]PWS32871.1 alpha-L-fucosidase [Pedobacter paludis]